MEKYLQDDHLMNKISKRFNNINNVESLTELIDTQHDIDNLKNNENDYIYKFKKYEVELEYLKDSQSTDHGNRWQNEITNQLKDIERLKIKYDNNVNKIPEVQEIITEKKEKFLLSVQGELYQFEQKVQAFQQEISPDSKKPLKIWRHETSILDVESKLNEKKSTLEELEDEYNHFLYMAKQFDCQNLLFPVTVLETEKERLNALETIWNEKDSLNTFKDVLNNIAWDNFTVDYLQNRLLSISSLKKYKSLIGNSDIYKYMMEKLNYYDIHVELFESLKHKAMTKEQWEYLLLRLKSNTKMCPIGNKSVTMKFIFNLNLIENKQIIMEITQKAICQLLIREMLEKLEKKWSTIQLIKSFYLPSFDERRGRLDSLLEVGGNSPIIEENEDDVDNINININENNEENEENDKNDKNDQVNEEETEATEKRLSITISPAVSRRSSCLSGENRPPTPKGEFHNKRGVYLLSLTESDVEIINSSILTVQGLFSSKDVKGLQEKLQSVYDNLSLASELFSVLTRCQNLFCYLNRIMYSSEDVQNELGKNADMYFLSEQRFILLLQVVAKLPCYFEITKDQETQTGLRDTLCQFESVLKDIEDYLRSKKQKFPRFYFLSSDDVIDVLSHRNDPVYVINHHINHLFPSISSMDIIRDDYNVSYIRRISSNSGIENLLLYSAVSLTGYPEDYLNYIDDAVTTTLKISMLKAKSLFERKEGRIKWINQKSEEDNCSYEYSEQIGQVVLHSYFCKQVEDHIRRKSLPVLTKEITNLITLVSKKINATEKYNDRIRAENLALNYLVQRDLIKYLIDKHVTDNENFEWIRQFRYSIEMEENEEDNNNNKSVIGSGKQKSIIGSLSKGKRKSKKLGAAAAYIQTKPKVLGNATVYIASNAYNYCFDYLGDIKPIFITPNLNTLTFSIYKGFEYFQGSILIGSNCSGKSTVVQRLSTIFGKYVFPITCSSTLDEIYVTNIMNVLCGAQIWGYFDKIDLLSIEVLSVLSTLLREFYRQCILFSKQNAGVIYPLVLSSVSSSSLNETRVSKVWSSLKTFFRPLTCALPNLKELIESLLLSKGYGKDSELYASTLLNVLRQCKALLPNKPYYDFSFRSLQTVFHLISVRRGKKSNDNIKDILISSLIDVFGSRIDNEDYKTFYSILECSFPNMEYKNGDSLLPSEDYLSIMESLELWTRPVEEEEPNYYLQQTQTLHSMININNVIFLAGPSMSGKTTSIKILKKILEVHKYYCLYPNSISFEDLIGESESETHTFKGGLLISLLKKYNDSNEDIFFVINGKVNNRWGEMITSLLDNSGSLNLPSGEYLVLRQNMKLLFETSYLSNMNPNIITKVSLIYYPIRKQYKYIINKWIYERNTKNREEQEKMKERCYSFIYERDTLITLLYDCCTFMLRFAKDYIYNDYPINETILVYKFIQLLEILLKEINLPVHSSMSVVTNSYEACVIYSLIWSFSSFIIDNNHTFIRRKFDQQIRLLLSKKFRKIKSELFSQDHTVFDYYIKIDNITSGKGSLFDLYDNNTDIVTEITLGSGKNIYDILVPTLDIIIPCYWSIFLLSHNKSFLLYSPESSGKTRLLHVVSHHFESESNVIEYKCHSNSSANQIKNYILSCTNHITKKSKNIIYTENNRPINLFIDDLNILYQENEESSVTSYLKEVVQTGKWRDSDGKENILGIIKYILYIL